MIYTIIKGEEIFKESQEATKDDLELGNSLKETLEANLKTCVGMAAKMIGFNKAIIALLNQETKKIEVMYNPKIIKASFLYEVSESCLSLDGVRSTKRYNSLNLS